MKRVLFFILLSFSPPVFSNDLEVIGPESHEILVARTRSAPPSLGDVLSVKSKSAEIGIVGFAEVKEVLPQSDGSFRVRLVLLRLSSHLLIQPGDTLARLDLNSTQAEYPGYNELVIREPTGQVSAKYRPLYTQGFSIGETAHTLSRGEFLAHIYGQVSYGLFDRVSFGTIVPGLLLSSPNGSLKGRIFESESNTVSFGVTATKIRDSATTAVNMTIFWDSVTSSSMTTHTLITFAVATLEKVEDTIAIKTAGSSTLQTGYEVLLSNWDRVLYGPSYHFETKTIGGYLAYKRIWDHFHLAGSLSTVNVRELKYSPKTGYVGLVEAYWRY